MSEGTNRRAHLLDAQKQLDSELDTLSRLMKTLAERLKPVCEEANSPLASRDTNVTVARSSISKSIVRTTEKIWDLIDFVRDLDSKLDLPEAPVVVQKAGMADVLLSLREHPKSHGPFQNLPPKPFAVPKKT